MKAIDQFMWGFQPHFRLGIERTAQQAFESAGFGVGPRAYLVGFAAVEGLRHAMCFEPEDDPLGDVDPTDVASRAEAYFAADPESAIFHSYAPLQESRQGALRDAARGRAIRAILGESQPGADRVFYVGRSALVEGRYEVHPVLSFPAARWNSKPSLRSTVRNRLRVRRSFQDALAGQVLSHATRAMLAQTAPADFGLLGGGPTTDELLRDAAEAVTRAASVLAGNLYDSGLHAALDAVAAQPYEGRSSIGHVVLAQQGHPEVEQIVAFVERIPVASTRRFRKALEMTDGQLGLLCDGAQLFGLGRVAASTTPPLAVPPEEPTEGHDERESIFTFEVIGRGEWQVGHRGTQLLKVVNTRPMFPEQPLSAERFRDVAARLFPEATAENLHALWGLASTASRAEHGTILVVHRSAEAEAERLSPQVQRIEPTELNADVLAAVTAIDGAVLVDPMARCHGVGVILDGLATGEGDPGRGARFNSAVRYHAAVGNEALIVIVSEDGMIDLIPLLRRRVSRSELETPLGALEEAAAIDDSEAFFRSWHHLEALDFYLTQDQCDRINAARELVEQRRAEEPVDTETGLGHIVHVSWKRFVPDPDMDPTYYVDEPNDTV